MSKLLDDAEGIRKKLISRNLYTPNSEYPLEPNQLTKIANTVNGIIANIDPFRTSSFSEALINRLVSEKTPIVEIGLVMLAKQLSYTAKNSLIANNLPKFNPEAIFDKNVKLFEKAVDYSITKKSNTLFGKIVSDITNFTSNKYDENTGGIFLQEKTDIDGIKFSGDININSIIENTGTAQLNLLIKNIGRNKYVERKLYDNSITKKIINKDSDFQNNRFSFREYNDSDYQTQLKQTNAIPEDFIWGIDSKVINPKVGLLSYTRDVLNKKFKNFETYNLDGTGYYTENKKISFNGNNLSEIPDNALDNASKRQFSAKNPYGGFTTAIRFDGNKIYGGNPNSVIYDKVIPKIHPSKGLEPDKNKNLMFSIENLAVKVVSQGEGYGVIDDDYLTKIPLSEIGAYNGRLMWFPPYNIKFNETTVSKFDETMMVGRGEPIYSYMNTVRTGTLTFSLLIDYPQQLKDKRFTDSKSISEFFSFGIKNENIVDLTANTVGLNEEFDNLTKKKLEIVENLAMAQEVSMSFPNNFPTESQIQNAFELMINDKYECGLYYDDGLNSNIYNIIDYTYGTVNNSNAKVDVVPSTLGQYDYEEANINGNYLDNNLRKFYDNPNNRSYYDIIITAGSSKLGNSISNVSLSERRTIAIENLIKSRLESIYNTDFSNLGIRIKKIAVGDAYATSEFSADPSKTNNIEVKKERFGSVIIERNSKEVELVDRTDLSVDEKLKASDIKTKLVNNTKKINNLNENSFDGNQEMTFNDINRNSKNSPIDSFTDDTFRSAFHSQTPEDFHRRLTFLQQCMRQGKSDYGDIKNSVFGRQPVCVLRIGDHIYSKVIINNLNIEYEENLWDMNPEGFGMQPLLAHITLQIYIIGGQSLEGPVDALQNAISFNHYANSTFSSVGTYETPTKVSNIQSNYINKILDAEKNQLLLQANATGEINKYFK